MAPPRRFRPNPQVHVNHRSRTLVGAQNPCALTPRPLASWLFRRLQKQEGDPVPTAGLTCLTIFLTFPDILS